MSLRCLLMVCLVVGPLPAAFAQGTKPRTEPFRAEGTVAAVIPGRIQMLTDSGEQWIIAVDSKATIRATGTAEPDVLRAGVIVRFEAELNPRGTAKDPVDQLTIFTPTKETPPGVWPKQPAEDGKPPAEGDAAPRFGAGVVGTDTPGKPPLYTAYSVVGQITGIRRDTLTVGTPQGAVRIQLAADAKIDVDVADYSVARHGDRVSITKGQMMTGLPGIAQAEELVIKLTTPLTTARNRRAPSKPEAADTSRPPSPDAVP